MLLSMTSLISNNYRAHRVPSFYSGCEAPSLKMGSVWLFVFFVLFFWGRLPVFMLIGWHAANNHILCSWVSTVGQNMVQVAKNEMWASEVCFSCLAWLYELFVGTLISLTNAYAGCGRPTLNFIDHFWLGSVRSASKLNSKCTQMNYEMTCITLYKCTEMYSNVLQTAWVHWR